MSSLLDLITNPVPIESPPRFIRDSLVELIATTIFVWAGTLSVAANGYETSSYSDVLSVSFAFGITYLALIHSIGHLSGGHMNPAVSLMMFLKGQMSIFKLASYWLCQFIGGVLGSTIMWGCISGFDKIETMDHPPYFLGSTLLRRPLTEGNGFMLEFVGSFLFLFVFAQTILDKRGIAKTNFPAIPIGLVLVAVHTALLPLTGCGINPARTFGPSLISCFTGSGVCDIVFDSFYWIYFAGPMAAAICVVLLTELFAIEMDGETDGDSTYNEDTPAVPEAAKDTTDAVNV